MITQYVFFFDRLLLESIVIMYLGDLSPSCLCQKVNMIYVHWKPFFRVEGGVRFLGSFVFQHIIFFYLFLWWTATGRHYVHPRRPYSLAQIHRAKLRCTFFYRDHCRQRTQCRLQKLRGSYHSDQSFFIALFKISISTWDSCLKTLMRRGIIIAKRY